MNILNECPICLENINKYDKITLTCNHVFHKDCLNKWINLNNTCPLCRCQLPPNYYKATHVIFPMLKYKIILNNTYIQIKMIYFSKIIEYNKIHSIKHIRNQFIIKYYNNKDVLKNCLFKLDNVNICNDIFFNIKNKLT